MVADIARFLADHPASTLSRFELTFRPDVIIGADDEQARVWLRHAVDVLAAGSANGVRRP